MIRVLFVCLGNICRSPMAEAVFQHLVREADLSQIIESDSAGTGDWHAGESPHYGTRSILAKNNIDYHHLARQIRPDDFEAFDYIITMDETNYADVMSMNQGKARVARLLDFTEDTNVIEVPDPYYTGGFEGVYRLVHAGCAGLLTAIRMEHPTG